MSKNTHITSTTARIGVYCEAMERMCLTPAFGRAKMDSNLIIQKGGTCMKLKDIFRGDGGYVVALVKARDSDGTPRNVEPKLCCTTFEEAVRERELLSGKDIIVCPPFQHGDISSDETADYFRSYFGTDVGE